MTKRPDRELAARALCRKAGHPENTTFEGRPMWESFLPEADAALAAAGAPHMTSIRQRYKGPWIIEEGKEHVAVVAADGTRLVYIYAEDDLTRRQIKRVVTWAEARAIAKAIAALGEPSGTAGDDPA